MLKVFNLAKSKYLVVDGGKGQLCFQLDLLIKREATSLHFDPPESGKEIWPPFN